MVLTNTRTGPRGLLNEISEGTHGHACCLSRGGLLSGRSRHLRDHAEDRQTIGRGGQERAEAGFDPGLVRHNYDGVADLVAETVARTKGRITAKRLLPVAVAAGYGGSARNFRRLVAEAKSAWRSKNHRGRRPGVWAPGDMVVFDWGEIGPLFVFCAVVAWSRYPLRVLHRQSRGRGHHGGPGRVLRAHRRGARRPPSPTGWAA